MKKKEILCINPNCLASFHEKEALFVCKSCRQDYKCEKPDTHFEHSNDYLVFEGQKRLPWFIKIFGINSLSQCPKCDKVTYQRACPKCHSELIGETEKGFEKFNFICMVGAPSSGKTAFLYSLYHHLKEIAYQTKIQCIPYTTITNAWLENMNEIFQEEGKLPATKDLKDKIREPFGTLFRSCNGRFSLVYRITAPFLKEPIYLISSDPEGEIYTDPNKEKQCRLLFSQANAIFYFINPLSIQQIQFDLPNDLFLPPPRDEYLIFARIRQILGEIGYTKKVTIPIAVIITHTDIIFNLLESRYNINIYSYVSNEYNSDYFLTKGKEMSEACKKFLIGSGLGNVVTMIENDFNKYSFFFTAANNEDPRIERRSRPPYSIRPVFVADPLLWILWVNNKHTLTI